MTVSRFTWYCGAELPGEVMAAALENYQFEPHFHDAWSIGAIAEGSCSFSCAGARYAAHCGELVVIPPRAVHTGGAADGRLCYGMAYIEPAWFDRHATLFDRGGVQFERIVIGDEALCAQWITALAQSGMSDRARTHALSAALLTLLARYASPAPPEPAADIPNAAGRAERTDAEPIAHPAAGTSASAELRGLLASGAPAKADVTTVARRWGIHRTTLVKHFAQRYGLPPDAWLRNWRIARAKTLMMHGMPLADIAALTGFADQAHLTRVFKRIHGSAPGVLRKALARPPQG